MDQFPPRNSNRNLTKEFNQEYEANPNEIYSDNAIEHLNRSYEEDKYPSQAQTQQINERRGGKNSNNPGDQRRSIPRGEVMNYNETQARYGEERRPRFNEGHREQNQLIYEIQKSQERQPNFSNQINQYNQNTTNSGYEIQQNVTSKSPVVNNYLHGNQNMGMQPQYVQQQEMINDNQMNFTNPYQQVSYMGGPYGEISFNKDFNNPNNLMSGSSTDRLQNKGITQGLHNYISAGGNIISTNGQNSAYNSVPGGQDIPGQPPISPMNKEYSGNPPTFHPSHQIITSSHLNSQNSTHTPPQITPKQGINQFNNFDGQQNQILLNSSNGIPYEKYTELVQQNSFSMRDRAQPISGEIRDLVNENSGYDQK